MIINRTAMLDLLDALIATGAPLDDCKLYLFSNDLIPDATTLVADLTAPLYTGYAASAVLVWGAPFVDALNNGQLRAQHIQFQPTGTAVGSTIFGWYITGATPALYPIVVERLPEPVPLTGPTDALLIEPRFTLRQPEAA